MVSTVSCIWKPDETLALIFGVLCSAYRPYSQRQILSVCMCVCVSLWGRDVTWQISGRINGTLGTSNCDSLFSTNLLRRPLLIGCCRRCLQIAAVFPLLGKFWRDFGSELIVFVQGKLCSILRLLCCAVYDWFSFFHFENWLHRFTMFVLCYFIQVLRSGVSSAIGSCLLTQGNISRLALCLVRIALKLARFRKPTFIGLKIPVRVAPRISQLSHEYLTSSHKFSQVLTSSHKLS